MVTRISGVVVPPSSRRDAPARARAVALVASLVAGLIVAVTAPGPAADAGEVDRAAVAAKYEVRVLELVNARRRANGLRAVRPVACATTWADRWSRRLVRRDLFEHSDLRRLLDRCAASYVSENLAMISDGGTPRQLVRMWMRSPGHRANILSPRVRLTGVSVRWDANRQVWVAVQNFVRR